MEKSYHLVFFTFIIFFSVGCSGKIALQDKSTNPRLASDPRLATPLNIRAEYPAWNSQMASLINKSADYFYTINDQSLGIKHRISVYNLYDDEYRLQWFIDGVAVESANDSTFTMDPELIEEESRVGDHLVKVELYNNKGEIKGRITWLVRIISSS